MVYMMMKWVVIAGLLSAMFGWKGFILALILFYLKEIDTMEY